MFSLSLLLVLLAVPIHALNLHHRILRNDNPFVKRAFIRTDHFGDRIIDSVPTLQSDFEALTRFETEHVTDALLYQLALDLQTDSPWLISSVKACHLVHSANEHLVLHLPYPGGTPFAFDYFLDTAPSDGSCPPGWASSPNLALPRNISITVSVPNRPPLPQLRVPPPLTATGDPIVPEPEKTFLQKYWHFIVIALITLMIVPGGEEGPRGS